MRSLHFTLILISLLAGTSLALRSPGLKLALTPAAINDFIQHLVPQVLDQLQPLTIQNFTAGGYTISNLVIQEMFLATNATHVEFDQGDLTFSTESFGLDARCNLQGNLLFGLIPMNFNTGAAKNQSKLKFTVAFDYTDDEVRLLITEFEIKIQDLKFFFPQTVMGKLASTLTDLLRSPIQSILSSVLSRQLKTVFTAVINQMYEHIPSTMPIPKIPLGVNLTSIWVPAISPDYILISPIGTFYNLQKPDSLPNIPEPAGSLTFNYTSEHAVQAVVTEYTINTALHAIWETGLLSYNITQKMLPEGMPIQLNVYWLQMFVPNIGKYHSNLSAEVILTVQAFKAPQLKITQDNLKLEAPVSIIFSAVNRDQSLSELFSLSTTLEANVNIKLSNWTVTPDLINATFKDNTILRSKVGEIELYKIEGLLNVATMFGVPFCRLKGIKVDLPALPVVDLSDTMLRALDGNLRIQMTPKYLPFDLMKLLGRNGNATNTTVMVEEVDYLAIDY